MQVYNKGPLNNESDVEQKLIYPLLTSEAPYGFGFEDYEVRTKSKVPRLTIDKRKNKRVWFPDYVIALRGIPFAIVEAKPPGDSIDEAAREARMYASELNAAYPSGLNPCKWIVVCDGISLVVGRWDSAETKFQLPIERLIATDAEFMQLQKEMGRTAAEEKTNLFFSKHFPADSISALDIFGEDSIASTLMDSNTFGRSLRMDFGNLFDPETIEERKLIARDAFVASEHRRQIVNPIDRLLRAAMPPSVANATQIQNTSKPCELLDRLEQELENYEGSEDAGPRLRRSIILLIGSRGSGKSTFAVYLEEVALSDSVKQSTLWCRVDLQNAPREQELREKWLLKRIRKFFENQVGTISPKQTRVLLRKELKEIQLALDMLPSESPKRDELVANHVLKCLEDDLVMCRAYGRLLCGNTNKTLVIVFDNSDKRENVDQLAMFESARWIKDELHACVFLPLRDITYDLHKEEPPLDTATSSNLVFRIDSPDFIKVLNRRIALAIKSAESGANTRSYCLEGGLKVEYHANEQISYLQAILRALYVHDDSVKRLVYGIAGRDVRRALKMFLSFCESGHFSELEVLKLRKATDEDRIQLWRVVRVLARSKYRFYKGNSSVIKNLFQTVSTSNCPNHFLRIDILEWLADRLKMQGPFGKEGFFRIKDVADALAENGYSRELVVAEIRYLVSSLCILSDRQTGSQLKEGDMLRIGPAGESHLSLLDSIEYISACAEETQIWQSSVADSISKLLTLDEKMFRPREVVTKAKLFCEYLSDIDPLNNLDEDDSRHALDKKYPFLPTVKNAIASLGEKVGYVGGRLYLGAWDGFKQEDEVRKIFADFDVEPQYFYVRFCRRRRDGKKFAIVDVDAATATKILAKTKHETVTLNGDPVVLRRFLE